MAKQMKSYRLDEDIIYSIKNVSEKFRMSDTAVIEMAVNWLYDSGAVYGIENVMKESYRTKPERILSLAARDGEITSVVRSQCWMNGMR